MVALFISSGSLVLEGGFLSAKAFSILKVSSIVTSRQSVYPKSNPERANINLNLIRRSAKIVSCGSFQARNQSHRKIHRLFSVSKPLSTTDESVPSPFDNEDSQVNSAEANKLATGESCTTIFTGSKAIKSQRPTTTNSTELQMVSFYNFVNISNPIELRDELFESIKHIEGLRGTIYISPEGVNSQMAIPYYSTANGQDDSSSPMSQFFQACYSTDTKVFSLMKSNRSGVDNEGNYTNRNNENLINIGDVVSIDVPTFDKLIVRVRDYVLRDGMPRQEEQHYPLDWADAGVELTPQQWHEELAQQDMSPSQKTEATNSPTESDSRPPLLLDCRNIYESDQGTFQGAIPLNTQTFQDTWSVLDDLLLPESSDCDSDRPKGDGNNDASKLNIQKDQPVYIYCTGGIRCVKVGAYLKQHLGYKNVKRLQHGIIGYEKWHQQSIDGKEDRQHGNLWNGTNFLFDKRRFRS